MDLNLNGRRALITGSTRGIGLATAIELTSMGASVVINGRSQETVDQAIASISNKATNVNLTGYAADLSTAEGCQSMTDAVPDLDILVNNMGIYEAKNFENISLNAPCFTKIRACQRWSQYHQEQFKPKTLRVFH